jgi:hemerythrin superfamily protein
MNNFDKNEYYDDIIKNMTRICHKKCFNDLSLSEECITTCYHKYVNTISKIEKLSLEVGKITRSEFVRRIYRTEKNLLEDEYIFPRGGKPVIHWTRKWKTYNDYKPLFKGDNPYKDPMEKF